MEERLPVSSYSLRTRRRNVTHGFTPPFSGSGRLVIGCVADPAWTAASWAAIPLAQVWEASRAHGVDTVSGLTASPLGSGDRRTRGAGAERLRRPAPPRGPVPLGCRLPPGAWRGAIRAGAHHRDRLRGHVRRGRARHPVRPDGPLAAGGDVGGPGSLAPV